VRLHSAVSACVSISGHPTRGIQPASAGLVGSPTGIAFFDHHELELSKLPQLIVLHFLQPLQMLLLLPHHLNGSISPRLQDPAACVLCLFALMVDLLAFFVVLA
jgi:hypothetical protein